MSIEIDFSKIRPDTKRTRQGGFEEMVVQLFARQLHEAYPDARVNRVEGAGGDGGVEAYADVPGTGKVAVQAKWFTDKLNDSKFRQIDESVRAALLNHPDLKVYQVYVPLDLTDKKGAKSQQTTAKGKTPKSQREKWDEHVAKWKTWKNGADVDFVYVGHFQMQDLLQSPAFEYIREFWFGTPLFDHAWMIRNFDKAKSQLAERYRPELNVSGDVTQALDTFAWSPSFEKRLERAIDTYLGAIDAFRDRYDNIPGNLWTHQEQDEVRRSFEQPVIPTSADEETPQWPIRAIAESLDGLRKLEVPSFGGITVESLETRVTRLIELLNLLLSALSKGKRSVKGTKDEYKYEDHNVRQLYESTISFRIFLSESATADKRMMLVDGDAGNGKSHLLAHNVDMALRHMQPAVLLLGEWFRGTDAPLSQIVQLTGWPHRQESILQAFNAAGELAGRPALLVIDALNEAVDRGLWASFLLPLARELVHYPFIKLIVSCRTDFKCISLPDEFSKGVPEGWGRIEHNGLGDVMPTLTSTYYKHYNIKTQHFPPLLSEFQNPLFLDVVCKAFEGEELPSGPITLETAMRKWLDKLTRKVSKDIDCDSDDIHTAITDVADLIREANGAAIPFNIAKQAVNRYSPTKERSSSLFRRLISEGLLVELIDDWWTANPKNLVRFGFERFSDYFIADTLLNEIRSIEELKTAADPDGKLGWLISSDYWERRGVAAALAILVPGRFGVELLDLLEPKENRRPQLLRDFVDSLPWRDGGTVTLATHRLLKEASRHETPEDFLNSLLGISTIPEHPLNAGFLHSKLVPLELPLRDLAWTIPLANMSGDSTRMPLMIIDWASRVPHGLVSDDQARLVGSVLLWFGSSTVCRFRDSAGHAAIRLLSGRPQVVAQLIEQFDAVNDPYVVERLYAVAAGVAMRERSDDGLRELAAVVYKHVFDTDNVRLHVLLRDYARTLIAYAEHRGVLHEGVNTNIYNPPYRSRERRVPSEDRLDALSKDPEWRYIIDSIRPDTRLAGAGWYGDFGRYTMQSATSHFHNVRVGRKAPGRRHEQYYDADRARRWVLDGVRKLGWKPSYFLEHDRNVPDFDRSSDRERKIERVGKKYQWIALYELIGYISDRYYMTARDDYDEPVDYQGPWQLYMRKFDPTASPRAVSDDTEVDELHASPAWSTLENYVMPFADSELFADRRAWAVSELEDPSKLLTLWSLEPILDNMTGSFSMGSGSGKSRFRCVLDKAV